MSAVLEALAQYGVRGAVRALLPPRRKDTSDNDVAHPRYVCARKKTTSPWKRRISIYEVVYEDVTDEGRKARHYKNVETNNHDRNERTDFVGVVKMMVYTKEHGVRRTIQKHRLRQPPANSHGTFESSRCKKQYGVDPAASRKGKSSCTAPSSGSFPCPSIISSQAVQYTQSDPHNAVTTCGPGVLLTRGQDRPKDLRPRKGLKRREQSVQQEPEILPSNVVPLSQEKCDQRFNVPEAPTGSKRKEAIPANAMKEVGDMGMKRGSDHQSRESQISIVPVGTGRQFIQPGMTAQESANLIFGVGSEGTMRKSMLDGFVYDYSAPAMHDRASQSRSEFPLTISERTQHRSKVSKTITMGPGLDLTTSMSAVNQGS